MSDQSVAPVKEQKKKTRNRLTNAQYHEKKLAELIASNDLYTAAKAKELLDASAAQSVKDAEAQEGIIQALHQELASLKQAASQPAASSEESAKQAANDIIQKAVESGLLFTPALVELKLKQQAEVLKKELCRASTHAQSHMSKYDYEHYLDNSEVQSREYIEQLNAMGIPAELLRAHKIYDARLKPCEDEQTGKLVPSKVWKILNG